MPTNTNQPKRENNNERDERNRREQQSNQAQQGPGKKGQQQDLEREEQPVAQPGVTKKGGVDQDIEGQREGQRVRQDQGGKAPNDLEQDREQQRRDAVGHKPDNRGEAEIREQEGRVNNPRGEQGRREQNP